MRDPDTRRARAGGRDRGQPPVGDGRPRRRPRRHRRLRLPQRPRHRGAAARARRARASTARSCWPRAWSSTARAATAAPSTGSSGPARARRRTSTPAASSRRARVCGRDARARGGARGRAAGPAQRLRRDQAGAGAPVQRVRARDGRDRRPRCATTTSTARGCRATRPTPASRASSAPRWRPGTPPRVFEDGAQRRDFVHVRDVARANLQALQAGTPGRVQRRQRHAAQRGGDGRGAGPRRRPVAGARRDRPVARRRRPPRLRLARARGDASSASARSRTSTRACASSRRRKLRA